MESENVAIWDTLKMECVFGIYLNLLRPVLFCTNTLLYIEEIMKIDISEVQMRSHNTTSPPVYIGPWNAKSKHNMVADLGTVAAVMRTCAKHPNFPSVNLFANNVGDQKCRWTTGILPQIGNS